MLTQSDFPLLAATRWRRLSPAVLLLLALGCGGSVPTIDAVTPGTTPVAPPTPVANIAGTWTGTVEGDNFPPHPVTLVVVQNDSCVDGEWKDATSDWKGAISGLATADSFSGQISFERTDNGGGKCQAGASISGPIQGDTFRWTGGATTTIGTCNGGAPQNLVLSVHRQS